MSDKNRPPSQDKKPAPPSKPIFDNIPPYSSPSNESIRESVDDTIRNTLAPPPPRKQKNEDD